MQEFRPLADLDNGALIQVARDTIENLSDGAEQIARVGLEALELLEGRESFQQVMEGKD